MFLQVDVLSAEIAKHGELLLVGEVAESVEETAVCGCPAETFERVSYCGVVDVLIAEVVVDGVCIVVVPVVVGKNADQCCTACDVV